MPEFPRSPAATAYSAAASGGGRAQDPPGFPGADRAGARAVPAAGNGVRGLAWPARSGVMPPLAEGFAARTDSVPEIGSLLVPGAAVALVPGQETAGDAGGWPQSCGKTQLACHLAGSLWRSRGVDFLVWVNAASRASVLSGYAGAAATLGLDHDGGAEPAAARFAAWLADTARRWLVVLDDLRDAADLDGLWPVGTAGRLLITAADAAVVPDGQRAVAVPVPVFSLREAVGFLSGRLTADRDQRSGAYDLAVSLGGEPAALAQAGAVMAGSGTGCRHYQHYFGQQRALLRAAGVGEPPAAAVTWLLSAEYAAELLPGGGTWPLLVLSALLDSYGIPAAVLTAPAACQYLAEAGAGFPPGPEQAWEAALALEDAGLISIGPVGEPAVWASTPLQAAVRAAASPDLADRAVRAAADALLEAWPKDQPRSWPAGRMRACAASLLHHAGDGLWAGGSCHRVLLTAGQSMSAARLSGPAAAWWRDIAARCERLLGTDHPDTLVAAGQLADALLTAGQADRAVACSRWVLDGRDRVLGPAHPAAIAARISLAKALAACGETNQALTILREAAGRSQQARGPGDPGALAGLEEYAAAFLAAGDPATAVRFCTQALAGREQLHGHDDPATLAAALRLAAACLAGGNTKAAIGQYRRVLAARERALGPDHPDTLAARASLAAAYDSAGQIGDALREHQQACAGCEHTFGPGHPATLARRADLAAAYHAAGQAGDAVTVLRDSIPRAEQALSPGDPVTRRLRQVLAGITADMSAG